MQLFAQLNAGRVATAGGGIGRAAAVAGAASGRMQTRAGACGSRQHDPRRRQHLLGGQPADRRMGRVRVCTPITSKCGTPRSRWSVCRACAAAASIASTYRHVIDWLVRKPGAFADYCYRDDLFPSSHFRLAYDRLLAQQPERAAKEYLQILHLAAQESESGVEAALERLVRVDGPLTAAAVLEELQRSDKPLSVTE